MSLNPRMVRAGAAILIAATVVGTLGGCSLFRKGAKGDYALAPEQRPLEVPPDLNLPDTSGAMNLPAAAPASRPGAAPAPSPTGFTVAGSRDEVFAKVGAALEAIDGLEIASRAQLLGSYDVAYKGSNFLVRVSAVDAGVYVSAVDPRGLPATAAEAQEVVASLQAALAR